MAAAMDAGQGRRASPTSCSAICSCEDVRAYREQRLEPIGITPVFPLWHRPTDALAREMIAAGVEARLVCVDLKKLPKHFAGRRFEPRCSPICRRASIPCGENGEFHTFVAAGPMLSRPSRSKPGEMVERDGFAYADLLPA